MTMIPLPRNVGCYITRNEHALLYASIADHVRDSAIEITPADLALAIATDTLWVIQWYPDTPVSFCAVGAATLERALERANET